MRERRNTDASPKIRADHDNTGPWSHTALLMLYRIAVGNIEGAWTENILDGGVGNPPRPFRQTQPVHALTHREMYRTMIDALPENPAKGGANAVPIRPSRRSDAPYRLIPVCRDSAPTQ